MTHEPLLCRASQVSPPGFLYVYGLYSPMAAKASAFTLGDFLPRGF